MQDLNVTVREVVRETDDAHSFVLNLPDTFVYRSGQHLTLQVGTAARSYSFSSSPELTEAPRITIKRTGDGFASNWLCDNVRAGSTLRCVGPSGSFTPESLDSDLLLFAGGSGITPIVSIAKSVLFAGRGDVAIVYANRDEHSVIFAAELADLEQRFAGRLKVVHLLESSQGLPTIEQLAAIAEPFRKRTAFICGPGPFMDLTHDAMRRIGVTRDRIHIERFRSLNYDPFSTSPPNPVSHETHHAPAAARADPATLTVELDGEVLEFEWLPDVRMLDLLLDKGIDAPYSCREGTCGTCMYRLESGEVTMAHNDVLDDEELSDGYRLACQSLPTSDTIRATFP